MNQIYANISRLIRIYSIKINNPVIYEGKSDGENERNEITVLYYWDMF